MFESLTEKLQQTFKKLKGQGRFSEKNMREGLREVQRSLLEADVNYKVVKSFVKDVEATALGQEVLHSVSPTQQIIKVVHDELVKLMGTRSEPLKFAGSPPTVVMLVGLQGSGKTTSAAKLAKLLIKKGHRPMLVAADVYRPAAIRQLEVLAQNISVPFYSLGSEADPVDICRRSVKESASKGADIVILDTAGRLHIDQELMDELKNIQSTISPTETLFVADAMTGQDAVTAADKFNKDLNLTGVILTKLDGDARGGAAISVRAVTGCPIKFVGIGEKIEELEQFHPDRMATRILGMGDIVSLVEKAQAAIDEKRAQEIEEKLRKQLFTLEDFLDNLREMKKMGPLDQLLSMIPGLGNLKGVEMPEKEMGRVEAIINSMTPHERRNPKILNGSRRKRIATGSGNSVQDVNRLLKQFEQLKKMMKVFGKGKHLPRFGVGGMNPFV